MAHNNHEESVIHEPPGIKIYVAIYLALMIGLVLTVVVAYVPLAGWNTPVAMLIAVTKALLVVLYFMHVRYGIRLTWVVAASGFVWLAIMLVFTLADYFTRGWLISPTLAAPSTVQVAPAEAGNATHGEAAADAH